MLSGDKLLKSLLINSNFDLLMFLIIYIDFWSAKDRQFNLALMFSTNHVHVHFSYKFSVHIIFKFFLS